jgi:sugar O-acyltransferase (sialic acid O-acetyltransferase NeuD family)
MRRLVIFGAGDLARLAHFYFSRDSQYAVVAFTVDGEYKRGDSFEGLPLVDSAAVITAYPPDEYAMFVAIGYTAMNRVRAAKYAQLKAAGYQLVSYVSSRCTYLSDTPPGENCFILEDCTIQPFVTIGNNVTLWSGCVISHDTVIEDHCFLAPRVAISGYVRVGTHSFIGINATIRNSIEIAPRTLVGAGAVVTRNIQSEGGVYASRRAKRLPRTSDEIDI